MGSSSTRRFVARSVWEVYGDGPTALSRLDSDDCAGVRIEESALVWTRSQFFDFVLGAADSDQKITWNEPLVALRLYSDDAFLIAYGDNGDQLRTRVFEVIGDGVTEVAAALNGVTLNPVSGQSGANTIRVVLITKATT